MKLLSLAFVLALMGGALMQPALAAPAAGARQVAPGGSAQDGHQAPERSAQGKSAKDTSAKDEPAQGKSSKGKSAQEEPDTVVLSDTLHYDDVSKTSTFTGSVVLTRGAMTLRADKLVTHEDAQGNQFGTATADKGGLVNLRQENPEKFETLIGTGQQADYDGKTGDVTLIGQATVTRMICGQAFDNVRGARIVYHEKAGTYEAFGGKDSAAAGGRVRSLAQPQSRIDRAIAQCRAKHP